MKKIIKKDDRVIFYGSHGTVCGNVIDSYKKSITFISTDNNETYNVGLNDPRLFLIEV